MATEKEIVEEYTSSLADLTVNSKPLINMLTMVADDNIAHSEAIVDAVEKHLEKVRSEYKLPVLYLIDSIVKNVGSTYVSLFTRNIVNTFCSVFEKVDEKVRAQMFKLRQTWNDVFPPKKLYALDVRVQCIDPAWPITASTPTPNIHVNPRFFNNQTTTNNSTPTTPTSPIQSLDPTTLDMQAQLINKHKELLELRQKKLELELLQAKAKLEEQQKQLQSVKLLSKTDVQKPVLSATKNDESKIPVKIPSQVVAPTINKSTASTTNNSSNSPRINPVNSAMLASVRPMSRDPRLLRQQPGSATVASSVAAPTTQLSTPITSNNFETVNIDDKHKVKSKSDITISIDCASNDKTSINKAGAQSNTLTRKDPRLISNKVPGSADGNKNKSNNGRSVSNERSPTKKSNSASSRKSSKSSSSSRSFKSSGPKVDVSSKISSEGGASSSVSIKIVKDSVSSKGSSDSTAKASPSSSPNKYKKKTEHSSPKSDKNSAEPKRSKSSTSKSDKPRSRASSDKYDDENSRTKSPSPEAASAISEQRTFKGLKASAKNRNYMRRNREISLSPEPNKDVDLRLGAPPEKQARLQPSPAETPEDSNKSTTVDDSPSNKDVDLRTLVIPAAVSKKRSSSDKLEPSNAKKSKSEIFDVLFGNEDVDLRQLPTVLTTNTTAVSVAVTTQAAAVRPPTPPPPIISTVSSEKPEIKTKDSKSSLDAIRAKLANATKKSFNDSRKNSDDTDMRLKPSVFNATDSAEDVLQKIIISQADEQLIKNGNLSQALVEKVLTLFETQKLQEAQRRESEEVKHNDLVNTTLTPISDDELSVDFSHSDSDDDSKSPRKTDVFGDTDDRVPPPAPVISQNAKSKEEPAKDSSKPNNDPRIINSRLAQPNQEHANATTPWHAHHRRRRPKTHWDSPPPPHPGPEPWLRPPPAVLSQAMYGPRRPFPPFVRPGVDNFGPRMDGSIPMPVVPPHILESTRTTSPPTIGSQNTKELPMADPLVLEYIEQDTMRTINIDGRPREIRYYEETAIVILSWDDPREISFQNGTRLITFDDKESFTLSFNDTYRDVTVGGKHHRIRLGAPTRELYIDGKWYECFFGGPGIGIELDGKMHIVKMDGPPPHVKIGTVKRTDLVAGKINLIINARTMVPVFLDAKPQKFDIEGKIHTLRFVDALRTVLVNEVPFKVEFGGLPKPITVHDKKHFIRFSVLPRGIKPGYVKIANMEGHRYPSPTRNEIEIINDTPTVENVPVSVNEPALPMLGKRRVRPTELEASPDNSSRNSPVMQNSLQSFGSLDVLSSIMTSPMANVSSNLTGYQVDQDSQDGFPSVINNNPNEIPGLTSTIAEPLAPVSFYPASLNINELFQKLVATGIVTTGKEKSPPPQPPVQIMREELQYLIKPVLFEYPETLKIRQPPLISALYSGMQCSSCGVRFPPEHSMQYSQHLDWHFRQNRRGRNSARKALCRKWYYDVSDWKNFEEIEDIDEREKNWFESQQQQQQAEGGGEDGDEEIEIPSVPADSSQNTRCEVCHDKFDQFYNEEKEEWHLRMAIREDGKTYHPLCYDDYKTSLANQTLEDALQNSTIDHNEVTKEETTEPEDEIKPDVKDEESEEKVEPKEELVPPKEEEEDDDIIIQEPTVEQIVIDDFIGDNDVDMNSESNDGEKTDDDIILPSNIKIKQEPMDNYEINISNIKLEPLDHDMDEPINSGIHADTTHAELVSSIDGNVQCSAPSLTPATGIAGKIKINITKPIIAPKEPTAPAPAAPSEPEPVLEAAVNSNEPLPPGEEPVQLNLKPGLQGLTLNKQPPVSKGTELTGLCSIM